MNTLRARLVLALCFLLSASATWAQPARHIPISLKPSDVIPTGNDWIALPDIQAADGSLRTFNVLSMRDRGLLQVNGDRGSAVLQPSFSIDGKPFAFRNPAWELIEYWIPEGRVTKDGVEATIVYCAPNDVHAAFIRLRLVNHRTEKIQVKFGAKTSFGALSRVTYTPVEMRGQRTMSAAPWVDSADVFSFITDDTRFSWSLGHAGAAGKWIQPPLATSPTLEVAREESLAPGETVELNLVLGVGVEEFSSSHAVRALTEMIDREGSDAVIEQTAAWCRKRTRTTGKSDLDLLMNRNFLFTSLYAWGRTIDTEQFVGATSRSPLYYVSAAYWDRDAMLWSFPALLDVDKQLAREALDYALTTQLRNTGTHSRFIDGVVLEAGFQLDEAVAPLLATGEYFRKTKDVEFLKSHHQAINLVRDRVLGRFDAATGLYSTMQDSQDEYQKLPFNTYSNVVTWRALNDLAEIAAALQEPTAAKDMRDRAEALRTAIMKHCLRDGAPGSSGPIFVNATDGQKTSFVDVPPGSLMKMPALGFLRADDPAFTRTYEWLHSKNYQFSYFDQPFGLPGSYRLPITTSWSTADHLLLPQGREQALKILRGSSWDGGIVSEGLHPEDASLNAGGGAFATAAGYVAHAICATYCTDTPK